ncbi:hypothetical protein [Pseudomonas phage COT4]|nr:hypothetical protein [Pseudomonas phage COT4]
MTIPTPETCFTIAAVASLFVAHYVYYIIRK